ncbi:glycerol-3-phosphate responsive antiterminator [Amedibacillus sp. YH-ame10]
MIDQKIIPVISDWKTFEKFLVGKHCWCILMDFHINFMEELFMKLHAHDKKGIVHMDLIKGVQNDTFGTQYMCQKLRADGIISTKPKAIEAAKANHAVSILRVFLIDSRSLLKSAQLAETLKPDYVEILPGIIPNAKAMMQKYCDVPLIAGGLIKTKEDVATCLQSGMSAITTSSLTLCDMEEDV